VTLSRVERADLREWLATAWRRRATPKLLREHPTFEALRARIG
jgi:hypothetical protein